SVSEHSYGVRGLQPRAGNPYAVFMVHPAETLEYHYERSPSDPRISHSIVLEVDAFGNPRQSAAIVYGRRADDPDARLRTDDRHKQKQRLVTYVESSYTNAINQPGVYRTPLPAETRTFELTGYTLGGGHSFHLASDFVDEHLHLLVHEDLS